MSEPRVLRIDRSKWMHGESDGSLLDSGTGKMCCMGFDALACGFKPEEVKDIGTASAVPMRIPTVSDNRVLELVPHLVKAGNAGPLVDSPLASSLASVNDDVDLDDEDREKSIILDYAKHGIKVEFFGECTVNHERARNPELYDDEGNRHDCNCEKCPSNS